MPLLPLTSNLTLGVSVGAHMLDYFHFSVSVCVLILAKLHSVHYTSSQSVGYCPPVLWLSEHSSVWPLWPLHSLTLGLWPEDGGPDRAAGAQFDMDYSGSDLPLHTQQWLNRRICPWSVLCLCCIQYIYACTSRHILSLFCLFFFFLLGYSNHPFILITILSCLCESSVHGSLWRVGGLQTLCLPTVQSILPSLFCPHSCFCFFFASLLLCISLVCGGGSPVKNSVLVSLTKTCQNKIYPEKVNIFRSLQVTVIVINFWSSWLAEPLFSFSEKKLKVSLAVCLHPPSFHLHLKTQGKIRF